VKLELTLAVLLNIKTFGAAVIGVIALLVAVSVLHRHPTRQCHRCGHRARLDLRICRRCGYDFAEEIRFGQ